MKFKTLILLLGLSALVLALSGCNRNEEPAQNPFPKRLNTRIYLDVPGTVRTVNFADDGRTPVSEQISNDDGTQVDIFYRPDFTSWRRVEYFKPTDKGRQIRREIVFAADGLAYVAHTTYRDNGTKLNEGLRLADGKYQVTAYRDNGKSVAVETVFSAKNTKELETSYRESGSVATQATFGKDGSYDTTETMHFAEDGTALYRTKVSNSTWSRNVTEVFFAGTLKVQYEVEQDDPGSSGTVTQFSPAGERLREWRVRPDKVEVTVYSAGESGTPLYKQFWVRTDPQPSPDSKVMNFELDAVMEYDYKIPAEGSRDPRIARLIEFDPGQDVPSHLIIKEPYSYSDAKTTQYLNKDGKLERQVVVTPGERWSDKATETETKHDPAIELERPIDRERCKFVPIDVKGFDFPTIQARPVYSGDSK